MPTVTKIVRYPIKGLTGQDLDHVLLQVGIGVPFDRMFALAKNDVDFDESNPQHISKRHFLMLMANASLAGLKCTFHEGPLTVTIGQGVGRPTTFSLKEPEGIVHLQDYIYEFVGDEITDKPQLLSAKGHMFSDIPAKSISIINLDSVEELERVTGRSINPDRFRGNVYVKGLGAWSEFDLVGKQFEIGDVIFTGTKRTTRCAATNVNPDTAERDINVPLLIRKNYGHLDMGIYADVIGEGTLKIGDRLEF